MRAAQEGRQMTDHSHTLLGTLLAAILASLFMIGCRRIVGAEKPGIHATWLQGVAR